MTKIVKNWTKNCTNLEEKWKKNYPGPIFCPHGAAFVTSAYGKRRLSFQRPSIDHHHLFNEDQKITLGYPILTQFAKSFIILPGTHNLKCKNCQKNRTKKCNVPHFWPLFYTFFRVFQSTPGPFLPPSLRSGIYGKTNQTI